MTTETQPKPKIKKRSMETINKDEIDALKIVKYWVESQLKVEEDFRKSVFNVLERRLFFAKKDYDDPASGYFFGYPYVWFEDNLKIFWNQHFIKKDNMLRVRFREGPGPVPEASGQVDLDTGSLLKDDKTRELKHILSVLNDLCTEKLGAKNEYDIVETITRNPFERLLANSEYKRLETAEYIECLFETTHDPEHIPLPFTVATTMNEFSTKPVLLIEHFVDPDDNSHKKYFEVSNLEFLMFLRDEQMSGLCAKRLCLGEAVSKGIIKNQSLAYFIGRVYLYLTRLGIDEERLRFRQNLPNVKDHYAEDCWMAEIKSSFGWSECVLVANRSVFNLDKVEVHHRTFKSAVIETSFVMGRIIYCLFEHSFYTRPINAGEQERCVFRFSPLVAPRQCYIFTSVQDHQIKKIAQHISDSLDEADISNMDSNWGIYSIVDAYAKADEVGVPFSITVVSTSSVTIRERDSQDQISVSVEKVEAVVKELCEGRSTWADVSQKYPAASSIQLPNRLID